MISKRHQPALIAVLVGSLLTGLFFVASLPNRVGQEGRQKESEQGEGEQEGGALILRPDLGLAIAIIDAESAADGIADERTIFERYSFIDAESGEVFDLQEEGIVIFVTEPWGAGERIITETNYYPLPIYPFGQEGTYSFRAEMPDGDILTKSLQFPHPLQMGLVSKDGSASLADMDRLLIEGFRMDGVELLEADSALYVSPGGAVQSLIVQDDGSATISADASIVGGHVFLVKEGGTWYHATLFVTEEG